MKTLLFFTSQFPYGSGETFIENEYPFLAEAFDKIFIITNNLDGPLTRQISANTEIVRVPYNASTGSKLNAIINGFSSIIRNELKFIRRRHNLTLNKQVLSTLFGTYAKALELNSFLNGFIARNQIDLNSLWLYSYWMNDMAAGVALFKKQNPKAKAFCRAHGWDVYFERHKPPYLPLRNFILQNLDACYCISANGQEYVRNLCPEKVNPKIKLSRLGTFNELGLQSGTNADKLTVVSCSNIISLKRIDLIIESLTLLKGFNVEWIHFGGGPLEAEIKKLATAKLSSLNHIKFCFAGQCSNSQLLVHYANNNIDLFINLSETEGLPVSIMEAGSFGIPGVATNVGGVSEIVQNGINGFLLQADVSAINVAKQVEAFYHLPGAEKIGMRKKAFEMWNEKFNARTNYTGFINSLLTL